ncbi:MAG TPA: hypothetical protein PLE24_16310, partial [Chitinispirillaceae bacterium]|nr:hypothetical protein [Chitinispirillaceae bacterium]
MRLLNLIIALGLCGFIVLGISATKSDPVLSSIIFDTLSIILLVGLIIFYLKRGVRNFLCKLVYSAGVF